MEERELLGRRIRSLRKAKGLSQEKLAELAEISPKYLSRIETGREENPTFNFFLRLAKGLKVDPAEIFRFEEKGRRPRRLREKLEDLVAEVSEEDLVRMVRAQRRASILTRFGARIRELRRGRKWTQEELAEITGRHRTYIAGIERGERNISLLVVEDIAQAFGVPVHDLFIFPRKETE